jgi:phospholipid N-methyltransferase
MAAAIDHGGGVPQGPDVSGTATRPTDPETRFGLDVLSGAVHYQRWMVERIAPFCGSGILELGAGNGNLSRMLPGERLVLTEQDDALLDALRSVARQGPLADRNVRVEAFDPSLDSGEQFYDEQLDTVVSANVLEHIQNDVAALSTLAALLDVTAQNRLKRIISLVPANPLAYGPMDRRMGHYRRYTARHLRQVHAAAIPHADVEVEGFNAIGLLGWFVNGRLLRRETLARGTVQMVERLLPLLRSVDAAVRRVAPRPIGQSLISVAVWT